MKRLVAILIVLFINFNSYSQQKSQQAPRPKAVIKEAIIKGYVAEQAGKSLEHGRMIRITINRYDKWGHLIETMSSTGTDTLGGAVANFSQERQSFSYNNKGQLTATVNISKDGVVTDSVVHPTGYKLVMQEWYAFKSLGKPLKKPATIVDRDGNWTRKVTYENGKPSRIVERVISYY